jgi:hypothetical protein
MPRELRGYERTRMAAVVARCRLGVEQSRALLAFLGLLLRLTVMPRSCYGGTDQSGDENWVDHIGEHSSGGPGRLWRP